MTHLLCFTYSLIIWPTMGDKRTCDCVKNPFQVIIDLLNGFIPLSPPLLHSPHSHFHPCCWQFNFVWGGRGGSLVLLISLETGSNTFDHCCAYFCIQLLQFWLLLQPQSYFGVIAAKIHKKSFLRENNINNFPLFTLGKHNLRVKKPNWLGANQLAFISVIKDLNLELVWTNPASGQGETWTQCLWIASPVL